LGLNVCIDAANPTGQMDLRVARAAAKTQGYEVTKVDFVGYGKGDDGFPTSRFAKMAAADCDLIMGFPVDVSNPNLPDNVQSTSPYASTGFVLVRRANSKDTALDRLPQGSEVGIAQLDTYAGLLYKMHANIVMHVYEKDSSMLADLTARRITAGVAWQPTIESYEVTHPKTAAAIRMTALPEKHMLWNLVALYAPRAQEAANAFNKGLYELQSHAALKALITPYQPAAAQVRDAAAQPAGGLRSAFASSSDSGGLMRVVDTSSPATSSAATSSPATSGATTSGPATSGATTSGATPPGAATAAAGAPASKAAARSHGKVPALYTEDQATKGELAYYQNCAMCHGPALDGQEGGYSGPALKGADFADPSYDFHVSDIFNFVAKQMPAATPGSLPHDVDVQIMAFILKKNGYPSGSRELVYEDAEKSMVPIRYHGK
jgi:mono/diheme cytochrome c family protein